MTAQTAAVSPQRRTVPKVEPPPALRRPRPELVADWAFLRGGTCVRAAGWPGLIGRAPPPRSPSRLKEGSRRPPLGPRAMPLYLASKGDQCHGFSCDLILAPTASLFSHSHARA